jgi:hypothetical protein
MNAMAAHPAARGVYLYCLARFAGVQAFGGTGGDSLAGVDERFPVTVLEAAGIAAVIGDIDPREFTDENLQALSWLAPRAMRHEAVIERVMAASAVLPVKFGTIFVNRDSLTEFLIRHRQRIESVLDDLTDRQEWSVKGYVNQPKARELMLGRDPEIGARLAALSPAPGLRYLQQKGLEPYIERALSGWVRRGTDAMLGALLEHAAGSAALRCHPNSVTGRLDRMVFNCSFLLDPGALEGFRAAFDDQAGCCTGTGLTFELKGPWPPYNFCPALADGAPRDDAA